MTILPPEPSGQAVRRPHEARSVAESYGRDAERYDRSRPAYPHELIARIVAASPGVDVLDVGCGTGIAARQFQSLGCRVLGVEPDPRMAEFARHRGLETHVARFEDWDPVGRRFDVVAAATAWHWINPVAGANKAADVLRARGRIAAFWHVFQLPLWLAEAIGATCARVLPDAPFDFGNAMTRPARENYQPILSSTAKGIRDTGSFGEPEQWQYEWERVVTRDEWLEEMPTQGAFTRLPPASLAEVLAAAGAAVDEFGGSFTMRYATIAVTATRAG
jgi:SAM-dependent methyltransferase